MTAPATHDPGFFPHGRMISAPADFEKQEAAEGFKV